MRLSLVHEALGESSPVHHIFAGHETWLGSSSAARAVAGHSATTPETTHAVDSYVLSNYTAVGRPFL